MEAVLGWSARRLTGVGSLALILLAVALIGTAAGLAVRVRGLDPVMAGGLACLAVAMAWLLSARRPPAWAGAVLAVVIGFVIVITLVGQLAEPALRAAGPLTAFGLRLGAPRFAPANPGPAAAAALDLLGRVGVLFTRCRDWLGALIQSQPAYDPVPATLAWGLSAWLIGWWAGWWTERGRPLPALLPALGLLAAVTAYGGGQPVFVLVCLGALLLLMVIVGHRDRETGWNNARVDFSEDIRVDVFTGGTLVAVLLVAAAGLVSSISIQAVETWVRDMLPRPAQTDSTLPQALGIQPAPAAASVFASLRSPGLPRQHLIGSGPELSRQVVMTIKVADPALRYYWRDVSYDQYTGRGWRTSQIEAKTYLANVALPVTPLPDQRQAVIAVTPVEGLGGILYYPGALLSVAADYSVAMRTGGDLFSASGPGEYTLTSLVTAATAAQLRAAPADYPPEIRARYLALPDSVPQRVLGLARDLSVAGATPFDRAEAIQNYIRAYPYTLDLPAPPPDVDVVDYYLFDLKRGYCDYAASAMVVLARAAGLPARLVSGYASGRWEAGPGRFVVTEADAHSWPEIYFPGYGWVEFEPTGGRPALTFNSASPVETPTDYVVTPGPTGSAGAAGSTLAALAAAGLGAVAVALAWLGLDWLRLVGLGPARLCQELFERLRRQAADPGLARSPGDTPYEFADALAGWLASRQGPGAGPAVRELADLYVRASYSPRAPEPAEARLAIGLLYRLRWQLWRARWRRPVRTD